MKLFHVPLLVLACLVAAAGAQSDDSDEWTLLEQWDVDLGSFECQPLSFKAGKEIGYKVTFDVVQGSLACRPTTANLRLLSDWVYYKGRDDVHSKEELCREFDDHSMAFFSSIQQPVCTTTNDYFFAIKSSCGAPIKLNVKVFTRELTDSEQDDCDDAKKTALIIAIVVGVALLVIGIIGITICCFCCPCCPIYRSRQAKKVVLPKTQVVNANYPATDANAGFQMVGVPQNIPGNQTGVPLQHYRM